MKGIVVWRVAADDGSTVEAISRQAGLRGDVRVFVNGRRAQLAQSVDIGDIVEFFEARQVDTNRVQIVAQRDGVLLVAKPAGVPTEPTQHGEDSVVTAILSQLKGGQVHAASRLDTMVSGLVILTLGRNAARRVEQWRGRRQLHSTYLALGKGSLNSNEGSWSYPLAKRRNHAGQPCARTGVAKQKPAATAFRVLASCGAIQLLELKPDTGRFHQLRAHASLAGSPLLGDSRYGGDRHLALADGRVVACERVALHRLTIQLPGLGARAALPDYLKSLWLDCGGSEQALANLDLSQSEPSS